METNGFIGVSAVSAIIMFGFLARVFVRRPSDITFWVVSALLSLIWGFTWPISIPVSGILIIVFIYKNGAR